MSLGHRSARTRSRWLALALLGWFLLLPALHADHGDGADHADHTDHADECPVCHLAQHIPLAPVDAVTIAPDTSPAATAPVPPLPAPSGSDRVLPPGRAPPTPGR